MIPVVKSKRTVMLRQHGLSLVELMVALVIALILTAGVIQIFLGSNQTYRVNEGMSRVQENVRFGMDVLQTDVRMAGFAGCTKNITNWLNPAGTGYVDFVMDSRAITGWEFSGTAPGNTYAVGAGGAWSNGTSTPVPAALVGLVLPGSDFLVVNRSTRLDCAVTGPPTATSATFQTDGTCGLADGAIVVSNTSNCAGGDIFQPQTSGTGAVSLSRGSGGNPGNTAPAGTPFANQYDDNASLLAFQSVAYYVGNGASGEPALFMRRMDPGVAAPQAMELVESVENMQILYGVDVSGNQRVDRYETAAEVTNWDQVISVRLSLLLRTANQPNPETDSREYTLIGTIVDPVDDRRLRQVSTTTIGVRNRLD